VSEKLWLGEGIAGELDEVSSGGVQDASPWLLCIVASFYKQYASLRLCGGGGERCGGCSLYSQ